MGAEGPDHPESRQRLFHRVRCARMQVSSTTHRPTLRSLRPVPPLPLPRIVAGTERPQAVDSPSTAVGKARRD